MTIAVAPHLAERALVSDGRADRVLPSAVLGVGPCPDAS